MVGPAVDPHRNRSRREDAYRSRLRIEFGCIVWGLLSASFLVIGLIQDYPLWALGVVFGGPLALLLLVTWLPLARVPVLFVVLACLGGIGWEFIATGFPPWTVGLIFVLYLFGFEEALSGLVKLRYLQAVDGLQIGSARFAEHDDDHFVAKKRIWGYLLATASSAVIASGFEAGGDYQWTLLAILALTFLMRTWLFGGLLRQFALTRFIGTALDTGQRWPHIAMALANVAAYGQSLHWLVAHGTAYHDHPVGPWGQPSDVTGQWFGDFEAVAIVFLLWLIAAFREDWTS